MKRNNTLLECLTTQECGIIAIVFLLILMLTFSATAATYTTVDHGDWSRSSTWLNGISPGNNLSGHQVNINHVVHYDLSNLLKLDDGVLTIQSGSLFVTNENVSVTDFYGELNIINGLLVVEGSNLINNNGTINMSCGTIIIDDGNMNVGNNGFLLGSGYLFCYNGNVANSNQASSDIEWCVSIGNGSGFPTSPECIAGYNDNVNAGRLQFFSDIVQDTVVEGNVMTLTYKINNLSNGNISNFSFDQTLTDGLLWSSGPKDVTGGISIIPGFFVGQPTANFTIANLPKGISTFELDVLIPTSYDGPSIYETQASLDNLPIGFAEPMLSREETTCSFEPSSVVILDQTECIGTWNVPVVGADFLFNHKSVDVTSTRPLMNVVLDFSDGTTELFAGLSGYSGTLSGTGANLNKCIVGVWIRSACNASGEGPEYGEYISSPIWDGICVTILPAIGTSYEHGSTVVLDGGISVLDINEFLDHLNSNGNNDDNGGDNDGPGHGGTGWGIPRPDLPSRGRVAQDVRATTALKVYPNPARNHQNISIEGLGDDTWNMLAISIDGKIAMETSIQTGEQVSLSEWDLKAGIYFLEITNGYESHSMKLMVNN